MFHPSALALLVAVVAVIWILSGIATPKPQANHPSGPVQGAAPTSTSQVHKVRAISSQATAMSGSITVTGISEAARRVELRSEINGQVSAVPARYGQVVSKGQTLVRIAVDDREATLQRAREELNKAQLEYDAAISLEEKGFNSELRVAEKRAALKAAKASLRQAELAIGNLQIKAPYDGVFDERRVEQGDYVSVGDIVGTVLDLTPVKFIAYVSERYATSIAKGRAAKVKFLSGKEAEATVTFIAAEADPQTRTFRIELEADNTDRSIKAGLTAQMIIPLAKTPAHALPPSTITLSEEGAIGIKAIEESGKVVFYPVDILQTGSDTVWLGGLPETLNIITVGQEYVVAGQTVQVELAETPFPTRN